MPVYEVACKICNKHEDIFRKLADYKDLPDCCGQQMSRVLSAPKVFEDIKPYKSMVTGEMITSRSQHRNHLKQHGCTEVGNEDMTPKKDLFAEKRRKEEIKREIAQRLDAIA